MLGTLRFCKTVLRLAKRRSLSPDAMTALQTAQFREIVQFAADHSEFYRERFQGTNFQTCKPADLPTLNKRDFMTNFDRMVTDPAITLAGAQKFLEASANIGNWYLGQYAVCHTSGSQGQPAVIVQDKLSMSMAFATQLARGNSQPKRAWELIKNLIRRSRIAVVTLRPGFYPSAAAFEYMPAAMHALTNVLRLSQTDGMEHVVRRLNEFQPNYLSAYASVLEMLAREEQAGRLQLRTGGKLKQITNMSEPLPVASRQLLRKVFGVRIVDNYAMAECMALSNGCTEFSGSHLNTDLCLVEVVDEQHRPVPAGVPGAKILVTNLYNRVQPFIRYEVGDVITISPDGCACGSNLPLISEIQGRTKDKFWLRDADGYREVLPYVFMAPLLYCLDVAEHQIVQVQRNQFLIRVAPLPGAPLDLERVQRLTHQMMTQEGLAELVGLRFEVVDAIRCDPRSGKVKRMLSQVGPPAEKCAFDADVPAAAG